MLQVVPTSLISSARNKLLASCYKVDNFIGLVTFQQIWYRLHVTTATTEVDDNQLVVSSLMKEQQYYNLFTDLLQACCEHMLKVLSKKLIEMEFEKK